MRVFSDSYLYVCMYESCVYVQYYVNWIVCWAEQCSGEGGSLPRSQIQVASLVLVMHEINIVNWIDPPLLENPMGRS